MYFLCKCPTTTQRLCITELLFLSGLVVLIHYFTVTWVIVFNMDVPNLGHHCKTIKQFEHSFVGYSFFIVASNCSIPSHTLELWQIESFQDWIATSRLLNWMRCTIPSQDTTPPEYSLFYILHIRRYPSPDMYIGASNLNYIILITGPVFQKYGPMLDFSTYCFQLFVKEKSFYISKQLRVSAKKMARAVFAQ